MKAIKKINRKKKLYNYQIPATELLYFSIFEFKACRKSFKKQENTYVIFDVSLYY